MIADSKRNIENRRKMIEKIRMNVMLIGYGKLEWKQLEVIS